MNRVIQQDKPGDKNKSWATVTKAAHPILQQEHRYNSGHLDSPFARSYFIMGQGRVLYSEFPIDRHNLIGFSGKEGSRALVEPDVIV
jgi:hypothetical protein